MDDTHIGLAHGNGGRYMRELIDEIFARHLANPVLDVQADAALVELSASEILVTTDGFTVQPLEFPGGDIGSLCIQGTVNDLAVSGGLPLYLTINAFIEEGLEISLLDRLVASAARAAVEAGVRIVAGDTKVVRRGEGGGLYLATTGIGVRHGLARLGMARIRAGDRILVSGPVGDHGIAVMLAREQFGMRGDLCSDAASVLPFTRALADLEGLRFMRDPTRGGLATVCHEICRGAQVRITLLEHAIPVRDPVVSVCQMLGYDPLLLACEGRVVAVVAKRDASEVLARWRALPGGEQAALVGRIEAGQPLLVIETELGGRRVLEELEDEPLPRIC